MQSFMLGFTYFICVCIQPRLKSTRRCLYRESSSWCIGPTRLWLFGDSFVNISSASSCLSCQRYSVPTVVVTTTSDPSDRFVLSSQEFQEQMKGVAFKDVVIRGKELSGALITALINVYIKDNASVDAISNHLRDICPLLYSSDDSICSKVNENICCLFFLINLYETC